MSMAGSSDSNRNPRNINMRELQGRINDIEAAGRVEARRPSYSSMAESESTSRAATPPKGNKERSKGKTCRGWLFTDNNYEEDTQELYKDVKGVIYGVVGMEIAPDTKTPHLQGYLYFKHALSFNALKKRIHKAVKRDPHIQRANGSAKDNQKYCKKDEKWIEWCKIPKQGRREDLIQLMEALSSDKPELVVWKENFGAMLKFHKGAAKFKQLIMAEKGRKWRKLTVTLVLGPTGIGKTRDAMYWEEKDTDGNFLPRKDTYKICGGDLSWWDGYEGQKNLVIDEYANQVKITELLGLLDGFIKRLPVKHAFSYALWTNVVITTNLTVIHENAKQAHKDALARRITTVRNHWGMSNSNPIDLRCNGHRS